MKNRNILIFLLLIIIAIGVGVGTYFITSSKDNEKSNEKTKQSEVPNIEENHNEEEEEVVSLLEYPDKSRRRKGNFREI